MEVSILCFQLHPITNRTYRTDSYWSEISEGRYVWQVWRDEAVCLRCITKDDCLKAFDEWLNPDKKRKVLVVKVIGSGETESANGRPSIDPDQLGEYALGQVTQVRAKCKNQIWGKVNSKLF